VPPPDSNGAPDRDLVHMLETIVDPYQIRESARLHAEAAQLRTQARQLSAETDRLREEIRRLRGENQKLRAAREADRRRARLAEGCSMEMTAGTSIEPR
jgi:uncharacterized coiled-coil DUF342 family protein